MDTGLFIESFAVGRDGAGGAARLLCVLTGRQATGKGLAHLKLFGTELGVALQKSLVVSRVDRFVSEMRQAADLRLGIIQLPLHVLRLAAHVLHLPLQVLLFGEQPLVLRAEAVGPRLDVLLLRFQVRDGLLMEAQPCGDGPQLVKGHLGLAAVLLLEQVDVPHDGTQVAAGIVQAADHAEKQQQQQQAADLQGAFQQDLVIVALGEHHRQRVRLRVPAGHQKRLGKPHKGEVRSAVSRKALPDALFRQKLLRHEAEAVGGIGDEALGDLQPCRAVRQDAGEAADAGGLDMVGGKVALVDGKAAQPIHRAVRPQHGHGQQDRPLRGVGQGQQCGGPAVAVNGGGRRVQMLGKAGELRQRKLLRPLPVGHHMMLPPNVRHAPVEQEVAGHAGGVAPLDVQAAAGPVPAQGTVQQHEGAGAVHLPAILTQRLQHGLLQRLHRIGVSAKGGKIRRPFLDEVGHVLRQMDTHDGDIPPQGLHIRGKGLHAEVQRRDHPLPRAFELVEEEQARDQGRRQKDGQGDHIEGQPLLHGAPDAMQF